MNPARPKRWRLEIGDNGPGWHAPRAIVQAFGRRTTAMRYADKNYWPSRQFGRAARVYHETTGESWERRRGSWFKHATARDRRAAMGETRGADDEPATDTPRPRIGRARGASG